MDKKVAKRMILGILSIVALALIGLVLYAYRWNITNPNKSGFVKIDNYKRAFIYHVPKNLDPNPQLIIVYHGVHLKSFMMQILTGHEFDLLADRNKNAIIVYPQGYEQSWNDCRISADYPAKKLNLDDVGFTEKIIAFFQQNYAVDTNRMFAVGFSNGGQMVMKLANLKPNLFKGHAVISANFPQIDNCECNDLQKPVSLLLMNGMKDPINPYDGGEVVLKGQSFGSVLSTDKNLKRYLTTSKCDTVSVLTKEFENKASVITAIQQVYYSGSTGKKVSSVKIFDGGHTIPNRNFRIPIKPMGNTNKEVDAPKLIWEFFMSL